MTELKTLKDFERDKTAVAWNNCLELLKIEAIKWVKHIDKAIVWHREDYQKNCQSTGVTSGQLRELCSAFEAQKSVLTEFFNLTEDDLK